MDMRKIEDGGWVRPLAWAGAALLILGPLFILRATDPTAWDIADLPFALAMVAAVGIAFEFALRLPQRWTFAAGAAGAIATGFLLAWGNLAVGFAGSEDNAINIIFFAPPLVALCGAMLAGFRPSGLAIAVAAAAVTQVVAGAIALASGHFTIPLTVAFTGLWLAASLLMLRAARTGGEVRQAA